MYQFIPQKNGQLFVAFLAVILDKLLEFNFEESLKKERLM